MIRLTICVLLLLFSGFNLSAQYSLTGKVKNSHGEKLNGASIFIIGSDNLACISDFSGRYLLENIPAGTHTMKITYLGFDDQTIEFSIAEDELIDIVMIESAFRLEDVQITANKLDADSPFAYTEQQKEDIEFKNMAQDIPYLVEHTPSMVVTSDAGAGIGYTGMRIRGSDATRINVTINGVPLNDSESHGVFWVNLPDFGSSTDKIQIQRGVGPSTNGSGAFGGSVGLNTNYINQNAFLKADLTYGSFNTNKIAMSLSTGLMNNQYILEGRYSLINSDGYIDRASSNLRSWYFSAARIREKGSLKINIFSGRELTYQAWNGVPQVKLEGTEEELLNHYLTNSNGDYNTIADSINLFDSGRNYNAYTYENEVDNYRQDHYQILQTSQLGDNVKFNATGHYTKGRGFFEQFKHQEDLGEYFPSDTTLNSKVSDLVRRRWLDNHFFGAILNAEITALESLKLTVGGAGNMYLGDHFGEVISIASFREPNDTEYYRSDATKVELNGYLKADYNLSEKISLFGDMQVRNISYETAGLDSDRSAFDIDTSYTFLNPKLGLSYQLAPAKTIYVSYARANREPVRSDFLDAIGTAVPNVESLNDIELGLRSSSTDLAYEANLFFMSYKDQLVLTGAVNDVGAPVRTNVDNSSRIGLELSATYKMTEDFTIQPNVTFSRNTIAEFTEQIADFDNGGFQTTVFRNSDIALSPSVVASNRMTFNVVEGLEISLLSKFVGKQYLDNTSSDEKSLPSFLVNDLLAAYTINSDLIQQVQLKLLVNNLLDTRYSSNGYTYSYIFQGLTTENYLYPQAGINFLLSASIKF